MPREKNVYVVLTHTYVKSKQYPDKWEVHEKCEIVDSLKKRFAESATCIVNLTQKTVEKNRAGGHADEDYQALISHLLKTYPDQFQQIGYQEDN